MIKKKLLIKDYNTKESLLFVDRGREEAAYANAYVAAAVNSKYKKKIYLLSRFENQNLLEVHKKLGFKNFIDVSFKKNFFNNIILIKSFFILLICLINLKTRGFFWFINHFKIDNVLIGDLIYDTYINSNSNYLNPKIDSFFIKLLFSSIFKTILIKNYILKYNVKIIITGTEHYSYSSGLAIRISTYLKGIRNFMWRSPGIGSYIEIVELNKKTKETGYNSLQDKIIYKRFKKFDISQKKMNKFYNLRKLNKVKTNFYTMDSHRVANSGNGSKFIDQIKKLKKIYPGKVLLFASHRLSDTAHILGITYSFRDYYDQFEKTLSFAFNNDDNNIWIFRAHPYSNLGKAVERKQLISLFKKYKKKNIFFCPVGVPIDSIKNIIDVVVSGRGTVALEFLCEQKSVLLAGIPRYFHRKLGINYLSDKKKYFDILSNLKSIKKPSLENKYLARKILYFYENGLHPKYKIDFKKIKKDKIANNIFNKTMSYQKNKNFNFINYLDTALKKDPYDSIFYSKIREII